MVFDNFVEEFYTPSAEFLVDWYFNEIHHVDARGCSSLKISGYSDFPHWITQAFQYLFKEVRREENSCQR